MVWALQLPNAMGPGLPHGDHVGFEEGLVEHFNALPPGEKAKFNDRASACRQYVYYKYTFEPGMVIPDDPPLGSLEDHEWPVEVRLERDYKALNALLRMTGHVLAADQALKDVIEELDPGVHQFRPLRIVRKSGAEHATPYCTMLIGRWLDSFTPEQTDKRLWRDAGRRYSQATLDDDTRSADLAFSRAAFGNAHLWREKRIFNIDYFFSDELRGAIKAAGLGVSTFHRLKGR
jgi:hypothetical protein